MGLVLWIDRNTFATNLLTKVFKQKNIPFYVLGNTKDFAYLVDDLKPQYIVIDEETAALGLEDFKEQYQNSELMQKTPFIALGSFKDLDFIAQKHGTLPRTFDPFSIPEKIFGKSN